MWRRVVRGLVIGSFALLCTAAFAQEFVGRLETPEAGATVSGLVLVRGFALDVAQISRVDLFVDGVLQHSATTNLPRIDIVEAFPDWEGEHNRLPGFETGFLASRFSNGPHTIHVNVILGDGRTIEVGRRTIIIDNTINVGPIGFVDIPSIDAIYDAAGSFPVAGWAVDSDGILRVDVLIDGLVHQSAVYGDMRPDVHNVFQDFPAALFSGFVAFIDSTRVVDGVHVIQVRAVDRQGLARVIARRNVQIFNSENNLRPFGNIDEPLRNTVLSGTTCGAAGGPPTPPPPISPIPPVPISPQAHVSLVRGWALDLGTRERIGRVSYVELLIDGVRWLSTDDCRYDPTFDAFINCYGMPRYDVATFYPTYPDSPRSGFMFAMDVGQLVAMGVRQGQHNLKVRVGDSEQTFVDLPNSSGIPVFFSCTDVNQDFASRGYIEFPHQPMDLLKGIVTFSGWAVDENGGVAAVEIVIDGTMVGTATYGLPRPDVAAVFPTLPGAGASGWSFTFDTTGLSDARHRLVVRILDRVGNRSEIGSVDFFVDNPTP